MTLGNLGVLAARAGDVERGRSLVGEALALFEKTDDAPGQAGMRLNLGNIAADAGEPDRARELLDACRRLAEPQRQFAARAGRRSRWPSWRSPTPTPERAARLLDAGLGQLRPLGDQWGIALLGGSIKRPLRGR